MGTEIQRASDADRERYIEHLSYLFSEGYISHTELEELRTRMLQARSVKVLNDTLYGFPLPEPPEQRRDWGIPERWVPVTIGAAVTGIFIAVVPATALAHHGDSLSNALTATFFVLGLVIVAISIITSVAAWASWDNIGSSERECRRAADRNRRARRGRNR